MTNARLRSPPPKSPVDRRRIWALRLIPVTAAIGPSLGFVEIAGAGLFAFRILVGVILVVTLGSVTHWRRYRLARMFVAICLGWTIWSGFSLVWAPDVNLAIEQTVGIGFGLVVTVVMFNLGLHRDSHLDALFEGWMMAYALSAVFAIRELITGTYLQGPVADLFTAGSLEGIAISFFGNPNNYAAFILLAVPFMLLGYSRARTKLIRRAGLVLLVSAPIMIFFSTSRLALIGVVVQFLVYAFIGLENPRQAFKYIATAATVVILIGAVFWSGSQIASDVEQLLNKDYAITGSDTVRWNLTRNGLWMTWTTAGVGVGAAGYGVITATEYVPHFVSNITDPHNYWVEVLSQHGVIVFAALMAWFGSIASEALRTRRRTARGRGDLLMHDKSVAIVVGLSGYLFASVSNSSFINESANWVFLASLAALAASLGGDSSLVEWRWARRRARALKATSEV
jgi:hypothetical protein